MNRAIQTSPHHLSGGHLREIPSLLLGNTLLVTPRPLRHHLAPGNLVARVVVAGGGRRHLGALLLHERAL